MPPAMHDRHRFTRVVLAAGICASLAAPSLFAGVSRIIQEKYRRTYENRALFLKVPVFADRQQVFLRGQSVSHEPPPGNVAIRFKVGDQVRILRVDFGGEEIRFRIGATAGPQTAEFVFQFDAPLQDNFPNSPLFDRALEDTFTEGLRYADLEEAKRDYVAEHFDRAVEEMASTAGTNRDVVLRTIAPMVPAYQDAIKDIDTLKRRVQESAGQAAQLQAENRKMEAEAKNQQAELARLRSTNQALQEKIDNSTGQLARLGEDLRSARGQTQGYQRELANLQRSLNLRIDSGQDLASQIAELGQAMRRTQQENSSLQNQNTNFRNEIEKARADNSRLTGEVEELKENQRKLQETLNVLSSKEDSLARQYLDVRRAREALENVVSSVNGLRVRTIEEGEEAGIARGRAQAFIKNVSIGYLEWSFPVRLSPGVEGAVQLSFTGESIDYVRVTPEERQLLRSLGERMKIRSVLEASVASVEIRRDGTEAQQEAGERERTAWRWKVVNSGPQDARLLLQSVLINKNRDEIRFFEREQFISSESIVRQMRGYLKPIPMAIGATLGLVLVGIVGIFRRAAAPRRRRGDDTDPHLPAHKTL